MLFMDVVNVGSVKHWRHHSGRRGSSHDFRLYRRHVSIIHAKKRIFFVLCLSICWFGVEEGNKESKPRAGEGVL